MIALLIVCWIYPVSAQPRITNTPVPAQLPQATATSPDIDRNQAANITPSPTFTPTIPAPDVVLEAAVAASSALVRDFPENGTVIGTLNSSERYGVLGQYFSWIYFLYPTAADGRAWIYIDNVRLIGDVTTLPFIDPNALAPPSAEDNQTATAVAALQLPGAPETATAESRILDVPTINSGADGTSDAIPTYTPPAERFVLADTPIPGIQPTETLSIDVVSSTLNRVSQGNLPPVTPIIVLFVLGAFGLVIAALRR